MVINKKTANSDVCFLVLARPADVLSTVSREVIGPHDTAAAFCSSVYGAIVALHTFGTDKPVILMTRPSMLARPHLVMTLRQYPNLRLIGWLGPEERPADMAEQTMVTVSNRDQLARAISAMCNTFAPGPVSQTHRIPEPNAKIEPENYRLSNEEINALLGTG